MCSSVWADEWRAKLLPMECWSVALASAKGDGVVGKAVQSSSRVRFQRGAIGRSQSDVVFRPLLSLASCFGSVEDSSAQRYVRVSSRVRGIGVRIVRFAHCNSLSSRK